MIVIYHHNDNDGYLAGTIARGGLQSHETTFLVGSYGETPPEDILEKADDIYILDYALSTDLMRKYQGKIVWIDHHERHFERLDKEGLFFPGRQELGLSGSALAWEYFHGNKTKPLVVDLVNARDVLNFKNPKTGEEDKKFKWMVHSFHEMSRSFMTSHNKWMDLLLDDERTEELVFEGKRIQKHIEGTLDIILNSQSWEGTWKGFRVAFLNCPLDISGMLHIKLKERYPECDFVAVWTQMPHNDKIKYRINLMKNNKKNTHANMAAIAKEYGGNGQLGSAGFWCEYIPWGTGEQYAI
jgi:hypothetical protein